MRRFLTSLPLLWVTIAALFGIIVWRTIRPPTPPILPPAVVARQDSIVKTRPGAERTIDSLKTSAAEAEARAARAARRARAQEDSTAAVRDRADSLARVAAESKTAADSATAYRQALDERTAEAAGLRRSLASSAEALAEKDGTIHDLRLALDTANTRRKRVEDLNIELDRAVKQAARKDKLFGVIPLPSRGTSFLLGAVAGSAGTVALQAVAQ